MPVSERRRPVPREWRDEHHRLTTRSHAWGHGWQRVSRTKGYCSCGARWPRSANTDNMTYADVIDSYKDHVEAAYYAWDDLLAEAEGLGYTVELVEYIESADSPGILGAGLGVCIYANDKNVIRIRERLRPEDRAWVLEHEVGHARIAVAGGGKDEQRAYDDAHYADPDAIERKHRINEYLYPDA